MEIAVNYLAVVAAAIAAFTVGGLWYSPVLFGKRWMELMKHGTDGHRQKLTAGQAMAAEFVLGLLAAFVLAHLAVLVGASNVSLAVQLGFWVWLGFQSPMLAASFLFESRPIELFFINASQRLVGMIVMSAIIGMWH